MYYTGRYSPSWGPMGLASFILSEGMWWRHPDSVYKIKVDNIDTTANTMTVTLVKVTDFISPAKPVLTQPVANSFVTPDDVFSWTNAGEDVQKQVMYISGPPGYLKSWVPQTTSAIGSQTGLWYNANNLPKTFEAGVAAGDTSGNWIAGSVVPFTYGPLTTPPPDDTTPSEPPIPPTPPLPPDMDDTPEPNLNKTASVKVFKMKKNSKKFKIKILQNFSTVVVKQKGSKVIKLYFSTTGNKTINLGKKVSVKSRVMLQISAVDYLTSDFIKVPFKK